MDQQAQQKKQSIQNAEIIPTLPPQLPILYKENSFTKVRRQQISVYKKPYHMILELQ